MPVCATHVTIVLWSRLRALTYRSGYRSADEGHATAPFGRSAPPPQSGKTTIVSALRPVVGLRSITSAVGRAWVASPDRRGGSGRWSRSLRRRCVAALVNRIWWRTACSHISLRERGPDHDASRIDRHVRMPSRAPAASTDAIQAGAEERWRRHGGGVRAVTSPVQTSLLAVSLARFCLLLTAQNIAVIIEAGRPRPGWASGESVSSWLSGHISPWSRCSRVCVSRTPPKKKNRDSVLCERPLVATNQRVVQGRAPKSDGFDS